MTMMTTMRQQVNGIWRGSSCMQLLAAYGPSLHAPTYIAAPVSCDHEPAAWSSPKLRMRPQAVDVQSMRWQLRS